MRWKETTEEPLASSAAHWNGMLEINDEKKDNYSRNKKCKCAVVRFPTTIKSRMYVIILQQISTYLFVISYAFHITSRSPTS
jgi:hypothetical protein